MFKEGMMALVGIAFWESIYMTLISTFFAYLIGLPLGLILVMTDGEGVRPIPIVHQTLGIIINIVRSVPFLILIVTIMPFTKLAVGTTIGPKAAIVGLLVAAAPFIARLVESSLKEVEKGVIEAAQSMGASPLQILVKVLIPEAKPSLLVGSAIAVTTILGYSAMAGFVGGGGLGAIAINYGVHRGQRDIMYVIVVLLVVIVQILQEFGMQIAKRTDKRL
ncbi:MAG: ABC transporter permease [Anaerotignum sp.]|nr:ABC transporter permease [Anaerotignum sp.]